MSNLGIEERKKKLRNKFKRAEEYFSIIKQDYPNSTEAKNIDAYISKSVASNQ